MDAMPHTTIVQYPLVQQDPTSDPYDILRTSEPTETFSSHTRHFAHIHTLKQTQHKQNQISLSKMAGRPGSFEKWLVPEGAHHKGRASFVWGVFFFVCGVDFVGSILCVCCVCHHPKIEIWKNSTKDRLV
jgi:hypothetical protein